MIRRNKPLKRTPLKRSEKPIKRTSIKRRSKKVTAVDWKIMPDGREICSDAEYKRRTGIMAERQGHRCAICHRSLFGYRPSFDHESGRGAGGGNRDDRLWHEDGKTWCNAALCIPCNGEKGSKRYHWVDGKYVPKLKG